MVLFGYQLAPKGLPDAVPAYGEVYADDTLQAEGVKTNSTIRLGPARTP